MRLRWRKSTASAGGGECVEVAFAGSNGIFVRHSREPDGPVLRFTETEWQAFVTGVRAGEFDG